MIHTSLLEVDFFIVFRITRPMAFHLDDISAVPHKPWVYFFYGKKEEILYIWKV